MLIERFTVVAQIINFLILVLLLRRFLYGPIVDAMQRREDRIRARLEEAEEKQDEAKAIKEEYLAKQREIDESYDRLMTEARDAAEARRKELMAEARDQVDKAQEHWRTAVDRETDQFLSELRNRTGEEVVSIARRALKDLADSGLEGRMVGAFAKRLRELEPSRREQIIAAIGETEGPLVVQSAFELSAKSTHELTAVINEIVDGEPSLEFVVDPSVVAGIELVGDNYHVAWSLNEHLATLEQEMARVLAGQTR